MYPETLKVPDVGEGGWPREGDALDDVAEIPQVEEVVGFGRSWKEDSHGQIINCKSGIYQSHS